MMDYRCCKCRSDLPLGETVCGVCFFDNQPTVTIHPYKPSHPAECFVCKLLLTEGKCMTPNCPKNKDNHTNDARCIVCKTLGTESKCIAPDCLKNKDNHTDDAIRYTQPAVIDHEMLRKWYAEPTKDPYTLSREELLEKTTAIKNYDPFKPGLSKLREAQDAAKWAAMERFNDKAEEAADAFSGVFGTIKSDGGPSTYFDLCNGGTLNDELERKGDEQWLGDSFHLGNVVKLAWRWGIKEGTDKAYDANKLIYSGARLLMKYKGVAAVRKSLQKLLDDPQFQEREKDK
jgi:hypothetical protein